MFSEFDFFLVWENILFTISLVLFLGILALQVIGLGDSWIDGLGLDFDFLGGGAKVGVLSFFIMPFLGVFGMSGMTANYLMQENALVNSASSRFCLSLIVAIVISVQLSLWVHKLASRFLRDVESHAFDEELLVGSCGKVIAVPENNNNTAVISVAGPSFGSGKISVLLDETIAEVKPGDELQILSFDKTLRKCVCGTTSAISQRSQEEARS